MFEQIFLVVLGLIWIIFATIEDIRTREILTWLNFSLIIFALGFRFFFSLFSLGSFQFFYQGLIGLGIFFVIGNLLYYGKMFAGGDYRLFLALGAILPSSISTLSNIKILFGFVLLFLVCGAIYGIIVSFYLGIKYFNNLKKEFLKQLNEKKKFMYLMLFLALMFLIGSFFIESLFAISVFIFIMPYFYLYVKAVDEACMIKNVKVKNITIGDWLYKDIFVGKRKIKATWDGLTKEDIKIIKQGKEKVLLRYGIQFGPVFLVSFVLLEFVLIFMKLVLFRGFF